MSILAGKNALLKIDISGTWTTVAYLRSVDLQQSADNPMPADLIGNRQPQHVDSEGGSNSYTISASGFASDDAALASLQTSVDNATSVSARVYLASDYYHEAAARVTNLSYSSSHNGAVEVSISLTLSDVTTVRPPIQIGSLLTASDAGATDYFGERVAISADGLVLAVGAPQWDGGVTDQGQVYVYDWNGTGWTQRVKLTETAANTLYYGSAVALSRDGSTLIVGARDYYVGGTPQGCVYTYDWDGSAFVQRGSVLTASDVGGLDNNFGWSAAITPDGSRLVVGATDNDTTGNIDIGRVYVYDRSGDLWGEVAILTASDGGAADYFSNGLAISADGVYVFVGASDWDGGAGTDQGALYVYKWDGVARVFSEIITAFTPSDAAAGDVFGAAVAVDGLALNVWVSVRGYGSNAGAIYQLTFEDGAAMTTRQKITGAGPVAGDLFGTGAAVSGDGGLLIVGARDDSSAATDAGAVYTFAG